MSSTNTSNQDKATQHWHYFLAAIMFYTRLPVPKSAPHSEDILNKSRIYFPVVGWVIGSIAIATYIVSSYFFSQNISVLLSIIASVLATGAFHEDGFADSCDGLGGGWNTEQVLTIMKDSCVGTYATLGLILILSTKLFSLIELSNHSLIIFALLYINGHTLSRLFSSLVIERFDYVQDIDQSKVKPITDQRLDLKELSLSLVLALLPFIVLFILLPVTIIALALAGVSALLFAYYCKRRIGGYTGDVLGAIQQISEVVFYFALIPFLQ